MTALAGSQGRRIIENECNQWLTYIPAHTAVWDIVKSLTTYSLYDPTSAWYLLTHHDAC